jgi:thiol-disulfide isomerase/thioredoxin
MNHIRALLVVVGIVLIGWAGFLFWQGAPSPSSADFQKALSVEDMEKAGLPNFEAKDINGNTVRLSDLKGKIVILNFWATWCAPCIEEVPSLIKLVQEYKGQLHLLAISGDSNLEDIKVFLKSFPELKAAHINIIWDEDHSIMKKFAVARLPESFVGSKDLRLAKKIVGTINWYTPDSKAYMDTLIKQ